MKHPVLLIILTTLLAAAPALAEPEITITTGVRSENHRQNGGVILSRNPVVLTAVEVKDGSGFYGKVWSTTGASSDTEVRLGIGISKPCLGGLTCRGEVGYWDTPQLGQSTGDILAFSGQISGSFDLNEYETVGFSAQAEYLDVRDRLDTQIIRADVNYRGSISNTPIIFQLGIAHNTRPGWYHGLGSVSVPVRLDSRFTITPTVEALIPINDLYNRRAGVSAGLSINGRL